MSINSEQDFNRHSIAIRDFEKSIEFLEEAGSHHPNSLPYESLLICALISYCRPFSTNEQNKNAEASPKIKFDSFSGITADEKSLHDQCMTIRNKALAHSEWSKYPTRRNPETNVISSQVYSIISQDIDRASLLAFSKKLMEQCHHRRADYSTVAPSTPVKTTSRSSGPKTKRGRANGE